jgi:hypothetical protein
MNPCIIMIINILKIKIQWTPFIFTHDVISHNLDVAIFFVVIQQTFPNIVLHVSSTFLDQ